MNKLLCIVGPTGAGKTKRAIEEYHKTPSILVSADSRQVYRGMDIVTGKDHPKDIQIFGIDIVRPDEPCSVSVWYDAVIPHIESAWQEGKQVIVVGGTGLYVKAITEGIETMRVPINQSLRDEFSLLTTTQLQTKLKTLNQAKFESMNHSDQNNPRRLTRAMEVASSHTAPLLKSNSSLLESNIIGLKYFDDSNHRSKIRDRVMERLQNGAVEETKQLLAKYDKSLQSMSAIGYQSIIEFLENKLTESKMIESWVAGEMDYAKRQMTWFRKQPTIWYDV
jgi:tRNA dimethylallyltransferase